MDPARVVIPADLKAISLNLKFAIEVIRLLFF